MGIDYNKLFGLNDTGAEEQELTDPAENEEDAGAEEQELTDPAVEEPAEHGEEAEEDPSETKPKEAEKKGKTDADRAAAARRRAAEREEAIRKAKEEAQQDADKYLADALKTFNIVDPYTKKPIQSREALEAYRQRHAQEQKDRAIKKAGMTEEEFAAMVAQSPQMQELAKAKEAAEREAREAKDEAFRYTLADEVAQIHKLDPSINSIEDVLKMETGGEFSKHVGQGLSYVEAFKLANFDAIRDRAAQTGKRDAVSREKSKEHLGRTTARGAGAVSVPAEVRDQYLLFNPNATEAEIQKHWARFNK